MNVQLDHLPKTGRIRVNISVSADMNFSAYAARKKANRYLADEVNMFMFGGEPSLIVSDHLYWRVPILFALPKGPRGEVGFLDVNVETSELRLTPNLPKELNHRAETITRSATPQAAASK